MHSVKLYKEILSRLAGFLDFFLVARLTEML